MGFRYSTTTLPINCFWVVADQVSSGLQLYTEEIVRFHTSSSDIKRVFGRVGVFLMGRLEVGLGALAVVRLSVGGLLSVTATVFLPPPAIDSSKAVGCIFYCSMLASNVYLVPSGGHSLFCITRRRVHLFYYRVLSSTTTYHKVVLGRRYT